MARDITVQSLTILMSIDVLGPDVPTATAAEWVAKTGLKLANQAGTRRPSLDGSLRQALRAHLKRGVVKYRTTPGHARGGELYLWSITGEGRRVLDGYLSALRRASRSTSAHL